MGLYSFQSALGVALVGVSVAMEMPVHADAHHAPSAGVRAVGASVAALVTDGRERSPTFRLLAQDLDASGWIVFVQLGSCQLPGVRGCLLHRVGVFGGQHYLRIVLSNAPTMSDETVATIGHELQHANEVVNDPGVREALDISELFRRIGYVAMRRPNGQVYETRRAVITGAKILKELRSERQATQRGRRVSR